MRNLIRRLTGRPVELSPKQEERMARMRARADAQIAKGEAEALAGMREAAAVSGGGATVGPGAGSLPQEMPTSVPNVREMFKQSVEGFRDVYGEKFDNRAGVIDPGPERDFNRPPAELDDEDERAQTAAAERAARDAARAPYRAPLPPKIVFTRIATTGAAQLQDVVAFLGRSGLSARAERVYGAYRVPDRMDVERGDEQRTYLEWEVAHEPGDLPAVHPQVATTALHREAHWVRRRPGEPSVLDEDVAGTLCARARLEPEDCLALNRLMHVEARATDRAGTSWYGHVQGVLLLTRPSAALENAHSELLAEAPLALPPNPALPFYLEVLDWEAVAAWVAPDRHRDPRVPSPLPHLPSDWQELLVAYLEVVGVRSEDCYGVQPTRSAWTEYLDDLSAASLGWSLRSPPKRACADGRARRRLNAAEHLVFAYRDRAEYQDGRARWRAYQDEVLHARLDHRTGLRPSIEVNDQPRTSFASEALDFLNPLDPLQALPRVFGRNGAVPLAPYCGAVEI